MAEHARAEAAVGTVMKVGACPQPLYDRGLSEALGSIRELGAEFVEIPVHLGNPWVDLDDLLGGGWRQLVALVERSGLGISALSNHQDGQLLLGPHGEDTDGVYAGTAQEKRTFAAQRLTKAAELAAAMGVEVVCGFTGASDYSRWFPWPMADGYDRLAADFKRDLVPVLDRYSQLGVVFAHECHPKQFAYNIETALWALEQVDQHPALGFNFDPANLMLAGVEPAVFVAELGDRIAHVHAKDGEVVTRNAARSGLLAHGSWRRPGRGFRFRIPGWGQLNWKELITELQMVRYRGVVAVEHEDPTMGRIEGLRRGIQFVRPLLLEDDPPRELWW